MACELDLDYGALAATAAHADENRADDRGGRDQAGVERFHRHRRARERSDQSRRRGWILRPAPGSAAACVHCEMFTEESRSQENTWRQIQGRRRFAPLVAYPNTQEMSSRSTTPTTRAAESERRACCPAAKRVSRGHLSAEYGKEQVYKSSLGQGLREGTWITTRLPRGGAACGRRPTAPRGRCTPGAGRGSSGDSSRRAGAPTARPDRWPS